MFPSMLVSPRDFHDAYSQPQYASGIIPIAAGRTAHIPFFNANHIPGSMYVQPQLRPHHVNELNLTNPTSFFNLDTIRTQTSPYPLMLPTPSTFSTSLSTLGLKPSDTVVIYDALEIGTYNAPRVAWIFRVFGHQRVHVLNNFRLYAQLGYPVTSGDIVSSRASYTSEPSPELVVEGAEGERATYPLPEMNGEMVISYPEIQEILLRQNHRSHSHSNGAEYQILDSRARPLFIGSEGYSDPSIQRGHIPGSVNVPLPTVLNEHGAVKTSAELNVLFKRIGVNGTPVIVSCNSGVTAATVELALWESGYTMPKKLYDGSWMEWGRISSAQFIAVGEE